MKAGRLKHEFLTLSDFHLNNMRILPLVRFRPEHHVQLSESGPIDVISFEGELIKYPLQLNY
jgi:hypothetical protein